jgi:hypothetical protein
MQARRYVRIAATFTTVAAIVACNPFARGHQVAEFGPSVRAPATQWSASLSALADRADGVEPANPGGGVSGAATMGPGANSDHTTATVLITHAAPGSAHTWGIHMGRCGENGSLLGPPDAYAYLKADSGGRGSSLATLPVPSAWSGAYSVVVQSSASDAGSGTVCGNYTRTTMR